jgi:hypothetical protein
MPPPSPAARWRPCIGLGGSAVNRSSVGHPGGHFAYLFGGTLLANPDTFVPGARTSLLIAAAVLVPGHHAGAVSPHRQRTLVTDTPTTTWSEDDLTRLGGAEQIDISTRRRDGSLRPFVPIWIVTVDGALYVRSYRGTGGAWYRHATAHPAGTIRANGVQRDVTFTPADAAVRDAIDAAYRTKYGRYGASYLRTMLDEEAAATTMQLSPRP